MEICLTFHESYRLLAKKYQFPNNDIRKGVNCGLFEGKL